MADFSYVVYSLVVHAVYSLLCVVSQYQELKAGRGRALDDQLYRVPNVHYSSQPTATSFMSSRKPVTYYETKPTPPHSPTGGAPSPSTIPDLLSPNVSSVRRGSRKSVKFGDATQPQSHHNGSQLLDPWAAETKSPMLVPRGLESVPLIDSGAVPVTHSGA
ncbi:unnamed protein product [Phaedon cochleariae]|uniref:Uncharacterized protein n=1 Tax=Phaedon cochleariae TaxID=80249 RepID=A0A9P0DUG2_PHACE|nr:unnamed protein product [Phaedon cochleariae]